MTSKFRNRDLSQEELKSANEKMMKMREAASSSNLLGKIKARRYLQDSKGLDRTSAEALLKTVPHTMISYDEDMELPHWATSDLDNA